MLLPSCFFDTARCVGHPSSLLSINVDQSETIGPVKLQSTTDCIFLERLCLQQVVFSIKGPLASLRADSFHPKALRRARHPVSKSETYTRVTSSAPERP